MFQIDHSPISFSESFSSNHHSSSSVSAILIYEKCLVVPDRLSLHTAASGRWCTGAPSLVDVYEEYIVQVVLISFQELL